MSDVDLGPRYETLRELGSGGMGRVFLVRDRHLEKELALKLFHAAPLGRSELEQTRREFSLLAEIDHPAIARAYDFGYHDEVPFFTTEYVSGTSLAEATELPPRRSLLEWIWDLVDAVAFLHRSGVLHLDIKPSNVIITSADSSADVASANGRRPRPVLIDFGLCREGLRQQTESRLRGSLPFMAPEYFQGGTLGPWTDVYALGVTFYRWLVGRYPRQGPSTVVASSRDGDHRGWEPLAPPPPSQGCPRLPGELDSVLLKCLSLHPGARFDSAIELRSALDEVLDGAITTVSAPSPRIPVLRTVGRESQVAAIEGFLDDASSGPHDSVDERREPDPVLLLTGPAGVGQSHLLREIKVRAQVDGTPFYLERGFPGRPVAAGSLLRCFSEHLDSERRERWQGFLSRLAKPHHDQTSSRGETTLGEIRLRRGAEVAHAVRSLRQFFVLAVDGLQFFDEISVDLLVDLVRFRLESPRSMPLALLIGYREEGPSSPSLRELTELILQAAPQRLLQIPPLGPAESLELYDLWQSRGAGVEAEKFTRRGGLMVFQTSGGIPARILELAQPDSCSSSVPERNRESEESPEAPVRAEDERLLITLSLLRKPARGGELARILSMTKKRVESRLETLSRTRLARREEGSSGWLPGPGVERRVRDAPPREIRKIHRAIATEFLEKATQSDDPKLLEVVHHLQAAGSKTLFVRHGLALARYLKSTYQNRTALSLLSPIAAALPRGQAVARLRVALEIAELNGRIGAFTEGIDGLRKLSTRQKLVPPVWRRRLQLRLAMLYSRRGDFREAETLFRGGLGAGLDHGKGRRDLRRTEFLFFLNEFAAMLAVVGKYDEAIRLCDEGLSLASRNQQDASTREAILNFLATRAHVAMRHFRLADSAADYEAALQIAEAVGSLTNRAVLLNNLAIVYAQSDRYADAIRLFREAEQTCRQLDEGPSLTFVYGNLALLEAKVGDFSAMASALDEADELALGENPAFRRQGSPDLGQRETLYLDHHRGLSLLYRGRYREARRCLERAIETGERMGESFVTFFDRVYRAEALLFEAVYPEAMETLRALADSDDAPPRVRLMALSRLALGAAWTGRNEELRRAMEDYEEIESEPSVPFLQAWDDVYFAWALAISGDTESGRERQRRAEVYFVEKGLGPGASFASWVGVESHLLRGDDPSAAWVAMETVWPSIRGREPALRERRLADNDLTRVLWPLLAARLSLEGSAGARERARAADLLAEAGDALRQNPLPEWSRRLEALRRVFGDDGGPVEPARDEPASSRHFSVWTAPARAKASSDSDSDGSAPAGAEPTSNVETAALTRDPDSCAGLVAESPAMRSLVRALEKLRSSDLPVLIQGETGTGKERVARILHSESARAAAPFRVLDCSTIPGGLLEVELFGARAGAFSDLAEDRPGILERASGGTLLIDHVTEIPTEIQAKLLRVLSEGTIRALGSDEEQQLDLRFLFSTTRDPEEQVAAGTLRRDLYHRMKVISLRIPPLGERAEDFEGLVRSFFLEATGSVPRHAAGVIDRLRGMDWPGNARQLKNFIQRLAIESSGDITLDVLRRTQRNFGEPRTESRTGLVFSSHLLAGDALSELKTRLERDYTLYHLRRFEGNVETLARFLGVGLKQAYRRCQKLGIRVRDERRRHAEPRTRKRRGD